MFTLDTPNVHSFDISNGGMLQLTIDINRNERDHDHWIVKAEILDPNAFSPYTLIENAEMSTPRGWRLNERDNDILKNAIALILYCKENENGDSTLHPSIEWALMDLQSDLSGESEEEEE